MRKADLEGLQYGSNKALQAIGEIAVLALVKGIIGYSTGLVILIADALASFADLISLFASYIGLKISQRGADKSFKYGYYKVETLAGFIISLVIIYFGYRILMESVSRIFEMEESANHILIIISVGLGILAPIHVSGYLKKAGEKINSIALLNGAKDQRMDIGTQMVVLCGALANFFRIPYVEGSLGVLISVMILKMGFESAREAVFFLLDYFDDPGLLEEIKKVLITKSRLVKEVKNIRLRRAGPFIFGEAFIEINPYAEASDIRYELKNLQEEISKTNEHLRDFKIFIYIQHPSEIRIAVPIKNGHGLQSELAQNFSETSAYLFVQTQKRKIKNFYIKPFNFGQFEFNAISSYFKREKVQIIVNNNMHSLLYYQLRHLNHLGIYPAFSNINDVEKTIKLLMIDL